MVSAWKNNKLIGFCRVLTDNSLFASIWNLIVASKYQKKGIGKRLVHKCFEKYPKVHFFVIADSETYHFYEKLGFKLHPHGMYLEKGKKVSAIYN